MGIVGHPQYVERVTAVFAVRPPSGRFRYRLALAALVAVAAVVLVVWLASEMKWLCPLGQCPTIARVAGLDYDVGAFSEELIFGQDDLEVYGPITRVGPGDAEAELADLTAYRLQGIDPQIALLARWSKQFLSGQEFPINEWALLLRGSWSELCPYTDPQSDSFRFYCQDL
jgi:hypothetical protein